MSKPAITLMLDSGAFSAWLKGSTIDIDKYIEFIKLNKDFIHSYVNLDVIPGSAGQPRTPEQIALSARKSYENLQYMKGKGLHPIPVFHQGEDLNWLERLLDDKEPYIGLSRYRKANRRSIHKWLDTCFGIIMKRNPKTKTHGFAFTGVNEVLRYPWTTVDSTSWALSAGFGQAYIPALGGKEPDFSCPTNIRFSPRIISSKGKSSYAMFGMDTQLRSAICKYIQETLDVPVESVCNSPNVRMELNIIYFLGLQKHIQKMRNTDAFDVIFATIVRANPQNISLTKHNANFRLLSYHELRDTKPDCLEQYITSGQRHLTPRITYKWGNESYLIHRSLSLIERMKGYELCAEPTS